NNTPRPAAHMLRIRLILLARDPRGMTRGGGESVLPCRRPRGAFQGGAYLHVSAVSFGTAPAVRADFPWPESLCQLPRQSISCKDVKLAKVAYWMGLVSRGPGRRRPAGVGARAKFEERFGSLFRGGIGRPFARCATQGVDSAAVNTLAD